MKDDKDTRRRLLALLDRDLFGPVLASTREQFGSLDDKHRFDDARRKVSREKSRYHDNCPTAMDIKENFLRDLDSRTSRRLNDNLRALGLPTLLGHPRRIPQALRDLRPLAPPPLRAPVDIMPENNPGMCFILGE